MRDQAPLLDFHQFVYRCMVVNLVKNYGYDVVQEKFGIDLHKAQALFLQMMPLIGMSVMRTRGRVGELSMSALNLPMKIVNAPGSLIERLPLMKLQPPAGQVGLFGNATSAIYLMLLQSSAIASFVGGAKEISQALLPYAPQVLQGTAEVISASPMLSLTTQMCVGLVSARVIGQMTKQLGVEYQQFYGHAMPMLLNQVDKIDELKEDLHHAIYYAVIIYKLVRGGEMVTGISVVDITHLLILVAGAFTPQIRSVVLRTSPNWYAHIDQLRQLTSNQFYSLLQSMHLTLSRVDDELPNLTGGEEIARTAAFAFMLMNSRWIVNKLSSNFAKLGLSLMFASLPSAGIWSDAAYRYLLLSAQGIVLGPTASILLNLTTTLATTKLIGVATKRLPIVWRRLASAAGWVVFNAEVAEMRWHARRDPLKYFELGQHYEEWGSQIANAQWAYQKVPGPSETEINDCPELQAQHITTLQDLDIQFSKVKEEQLPNNISVYVKTRRRIVKSFYDHGDRLEKQQQYQLAIDQYRQVLPPTAAMLTLCGVDSVATLINNFKSYSIETKNNWPLAVRVYLAAQAHIALCQLELAKENAADCDTHSVCEQVKQWLRDCRDNILKLDCNETTPVKYAVILARFKIFRRINPNIAAGIQSLFTLHAKYYTSGGQQKNSQELAADLEDLECKLKILDEWKILLNQVGKANFHSLVESQLFLLQQNLDTPAKKMDFVRRSNLFTSLSNLSLMDYSWGVLKHGIQQLKAEQRKQKFLDLIEPVIAKTIHYLIDQCMDVSLGDNVEKLLPVIEGFIQLVNCCIKDSPLGFKTLIDRANGDMCWQDWPKQAEIYKDQNNYGMAFLFYYLTVKQIESTGLLKNDLGRNTYYRALYNCGNTLQLIAREASDPVTVQQLLKKALQFHHRVKEKSGNVSLTDSHNSRPLVYFSQQASITIAAQLPKVVDDEKEQMEQLSFNHG